MNKIMIIEDDENFIEVLKDYFDEEDYEVEGFTSSTPALKKLKTTHYDLILLDYFLKKENGKIVTEKIRQLNKDIFICFLTAYSDKVTATEAFKSGVQGYIDKSGKFEHMIHSIKSILYASKKAQEISTKKDTKPVFSQRLKELRELKNMNQEDLAEKLGLKRGAISKYELGKSEPSINNLIQIADLFKVSIDFLVGRTD
jgi:DNA-binding response OmpR family regulator